MEPVQRHFDPVEKTVDPHGHFIKTLANPLKNFAPFFCCKNTVIFQGDCLEILRSFPEDAIDMVFADPPYMLSNDGFTCQNGKMVGVNKGKWDKSGGFEHDMLFHNEWISACRRVLKPEGTIWISGTYHSIYQCGYLLQKNNFHILNDIAWFKPNAAPNLSCRFFTASHETILWARKDKEAKHTFNYREMKSGHFPEDKLKNENTQMRSVWSIPAPGNREKEQGKHPTQKPLELLKRIVLASTNEDDIVLDPFCGSGTTGAACGYFGNRSFAGIEIDKNYCDLALKRLSRANARYIHPA
ncbi:MAG: site-specific DNA-methyltransferase [Treponema sp.]|jgi:site-specific DNA-methyltransferase (adenine-specific)|nr:site-specific DNA-methyltransferase [Treponema sp.]